MTRSDGVRLSLRGVLTNAAGVVLASGLLIGSVATAFADPSDPSTPVPTSAQAPASAQAEDTSRQQGPTSNTTGG